MKKPEVKIGSSTALFRLILAVAGVLFLLVTLVVFATKQQLNEVTGPNGNSKLSGSANSLPRTFSNALEEKTINELDAFANWLRTHDVRGYIGEFGWPQDTTGWENIAKTWLNIANEHEIATAYWATGSWWDNYALSAYTPASGTHILSNTTSTGLALEQLMSGKEYGINLAGLEFGTENRLFHAGNPGAAGVDYFAEPTESIAYLSSRGVKSIRLPFRWERLQPELYGPLSPPYLGEIRRIMDAAHANNITVVLDLHNYAVYESSTGQKRLGTIELPHEALVDIWLRLSRELKNHPALQRYGIMNEPHDMAAGPYGSPVKNWEVASQKVVSELRAIGDNTQIAVAGYDWSSLARWQRNHQASWINDPAKNFVYEAHHYWDGDGSGTYTSSFEQELSAAKN